MLVQRFSQQHWEAGPSPARCPVAAGPHLMPQASLPFDLGAYT